MHTVVVNLVGSCAVRRKLQPADFRDVAGRGCKPWLKVLPQEQVRNGMNHKPVDEDV